MRAPLSPNVLALSLALTLLGCQAGPQPWPGTLQRWGSVREALRDGRTEARVELSHAARPHLYGVGALADLAGEVTVIDGEVWVTEGDPVAPLTTRDATGSATLLALAEVPRWTETPVTEVVPPDALGDWLVARARDAGLDPTRTFPFQVVGGLDPLTLHVIDGQCPHRAAMTGEALDSPPYRWSGSGDDGRVVGLFAPGAAGVLTHANSPLHAHVVLADEPISGHVDSVGLLPGAVLLLPAR